MSLWTTVRREERPGVPDPAARRPQPAASGRRGPGDTLRAVLPVPLLQAAPLARFPPRGHRDGHDND
ncbi:hypothetical protein E2C00_06970 [Streptomyces sp. WAC05374]|uniref:hypothetical protein n=1 Tax=Streptomyces sp. WAC05374 TaxID=2487420 RepID=UPI000F881ED3|nr:hypothetical protein [Streptomyces sp. WAC05374]RST10629.1 hypothetical protein EF905_26885 [Streptomyces sp. WAC05374]TDF45339.1 hypothetical protein E2B92_13620 [Streptomyces sp. WAC05374]TDF55673.1 hypothetical protein E2C02_14080 [Streptomyces sp. WAC05374]TDF58810.1 hypothetical protein E2C00_06970 [Streptomyces sp. WAC05374]